MADYDAMVLTTIQMLANGDIEDFASIYAMPDFWTYENNPAQMTPSISRQNGHRTGGSGSYLLEIEYLTIAASGNVGYIEQDFILNGNDSLNARGHYNLLTFTFSAWIQKYSGAGTVTARVIMEFYDEDDALLGSVASGYSSLSSSWVQLSKANVIPYATTAYIKVRIDINAAAIGGAKEFRIDDCSLTTTYTFNRNPTYPDTQQIEEPRRTFQRTINGKLVRYRPRGGVAKYNKTLRFGMVNDTQMRSMRSLRLLDYPLVWTPYLPHLPASLTVWWVNAFDFALIVGLELYHGTVQFSER